MRFTNRKTGVRLSWIILAGIDVGERLTAGINNFEASRQSLHSPRRWEATH